MRSGSSTTWYWRTMPPMLATSATSGTVLSSNFRNQSFSARSCEMSFLPVRSTKRVLVDPANAGGVRPQRGIGTRRQPALHLVQVLHDARPRPIRVGLVVEEHVDERVPEEASSPRTTFAPGTLSIVVVSGYVTRSSTTCGALPGYGVRTMTCVSDRSGSASSVMRLADQMPATTMNAVAISTRKRLRTDHLMRAAITSTLPCG